MKRNNKRMGKALTADPIPAANDLFPVEVETLDEHRPRDLGDEGDYFAAHEDEAEEAPPAEEGRQPRKAKPRTRIRPTTPWVCTCARWAPSRC